MLSQLRGDSDIWLLQGKLGRIGLSPGEASGLDQGEVALHLVRTARWVTEVQQGAGIVMAGRDDAADARLAQQQGERQWALVVGGADDRQVISAPPQARHEG